MLREGWRGPAGLDTRFEMMEQDAPSRVALAKVPLCVRPARMLARQQRPTVCHRLKGEYGIGPNGITGSLGAFPDDAIRIVRRNPPLEISLTREAEFPFCANSTRTLDFAGFPRPKAFGCRQRLTNTFARGTNFDLVIDGGHRVSQFVIEPVGCDGSSVPGSRSLASLEHRRSRRIHDPFPRQQDRRQFPLRGPRPPS